MLTCVIPDLHGRFDLLQDALSAIRGKADKVIFLGDYIDRGPQSAQCVKRIRNGIENGLPWIALKGNHEDFMASAIIDQDQMMEGSWLMNGGGDTIQSYDEKECMDSDAAWMKRLPAFHQDAHRVYVHAFAPEHYSLEEAPEHTLLWTRYPNRADVGYRGKHVVHGHTPKSHGPELYTMRTNLDCGAVWTGRLCIGVFSDATAGGPVDLIQVSRQ
ncbi:metallophosphoesterase [Paracoccus homiensis]|uniref:Serine/threonine protein phosphatase 1 n=1 Tax=Paracoccus homiensis TaxID=364199 RepID=A0A1I0IYH7_9RHOB|nr:metallophosphoesterase [Paracoccus homiensis]SEU02484.1 serine/threonine protein phosphatase 1 [Paracoccus homiensis]